MDTFFWILASTFIIAAFSLAGIAVMFLKERLFDNLVLALVALSAGAMFGNAVFHLFPEIIETLETEKISVFACMLLFASAFVFSFLFEKVFVWRHCHGTSHHNGVGLPHACKHHVKPYAQLALLSDGIHNVIDGLVIAAAFVVSPALGVTTTLAIALHEIPQELGDYAVIVHGGYKKRRALFLNYLAASTVVVGGVVGFFLTRSVDIAVPLLLPFAAGSFIYIAAADLMPELKHEEKISQAVLHTGVFLLGIAIMAVTSLME
jgi:zinc and cadmium transporter